MKQQLKSSPWFLFPLTLPPLQRYCVLFLGPLFVVLLWWSWIYGPLRKHRATLMQQCMPHDDRIVGERLNQLQQSLQQLSCKELSAIASLAQVTFEEIKCIAPNKRALSFFGTYNSVLRCLQELYERCPGMHIEKMHVESRNKMIRSVQLEISTGDATQITGEYFNFARDPFVYHLPQRIVAEGQINGEIIKVLQTDASNIQIRRKKALQLR